MNAKVDLASVVGLDAEEGALECRITYLRAVADVYADTLAYLRKARESLPPPPPALSLLTRVAEPSLRVLAEGKGRERKRRKKPKAVAEPSYRDLSGIFTAIRGFLARCPEGASFTELGDALGAKTKEERNALSTALLYHAQQGNLTRTGPVRSYLYTLPDVGDEEAPGDKKPRRTTKRTKSRGYVAWDEMLLPIIEAEGEIMFAVLYSRVRRLNPRAPKHYLSRQWLDRKVAQGLVECVGEGDTRVIRWRKDDSGEQETTH